MRGAGCPRQDCCRVRPRCDGRDGHVCPPDGRDRYAGTPRAGGLAGDVRGHACGDGSDRRLLEAGLARARRRLHPGVNECAARAECSGAQKRQDRRQVARRLVGSGADPQQLCAARADSGVARSHPDPQATGPRAQSAHAAHSENAGGRQSQADGSHQRCPRPEWTGDPHRPGRGRDRSGAPHRSDRTGSRPPARSWCRPCTGG